MRFDGAELSLHLHDRPEWTEQVFKDPLCQPWARGELDKEIRRFARRESPRESGLARFAGKDIQHMKRLHPSCQLVQMKFGAVTMNNGYHFLEAHVVVVFAAPGALHDPDFVNLFLR